MLSEILVPHLGANIDEGHVSTWQKDVGDAVREGDILCTFETSKATFDIEAEASGYVVKILKSDETVPVLTVIGFLGDSPDEPLEG
jgi:pyruvate/2-oxoglutarate dehydrogenase complex dihydrolipoamide acyltransferase (E2) component